MTDTRNWTRVFNVLASGTTTTVWGTRYHVSDIGTNATIEIHPKGTANRPRGLVIEAVQLYEPLLPLSAGIYNDTDVMSGFAGAWTGGTHASTYGNTYHIAFVPSATLTLPIADAVESFDVI